MSHPPATLTTETKSGASKTQRWLLAHDIADPKRLQKTWRLLRKACIPLQYSLYLVQGSRHELDLLLEQLRVIIDQRRDDIRVYPMGESTRLWGLGTQLNNGDNTFTADLFQHGDPNAAIGEPASDTMPEDLGLAEALKAGKSLHKPMNLWGILD